MSNKEEELEKQKLEAQEEQAYAQDVARLEKSLQQKQNLLKEHRNDAQAHMWLLLGDAMNNVSQESLDFEANIAKNVKESIQPMDSTMDKRMLLPSFITSHPVDDRVLVSGKKSFVITAYISYDGKGYKKSVLGTLEQTADDLIGTILQKVKSQNDPQVNETAGDWVLKAQGSAQYMYGNKQLREFEYITNAMLKQQRVEMILFQANYAIDKRSSQIVDVELRNVDIISRKIPDMEPYSYDQSKIHIEKNNATEMDVISMWDLKKNFRVKIKSLPSFNYNEIASLVGDTADGIPLFISAELVHGLTPLTSKLKTKTIYYDSAAHMYPVWNQYLTFDMKICDLPKETVLQITLHCDNKKETQIGKLRFTLIDSRNTLKSGPISSKMWRISILNGDELRTCCSASGDAVACSITLELDTYCLPVIFPANCTAELPKHFEEAYEEYERRMQKGSYDNIDLQKLIQSDPIDDFTPEEKWVVWNSRETLANNPKALAKVAQSVPYKYPKARRIMHDLLAKWKEPSIYESFELLDFSFADTAIRDYAVRKLDGLKDDELNDFLIQICQCMKNELYHDSSLARFLLERGMKAPHRIGHSVFWCLKSELHVPMLQERLAAVLRSYLNNCPKHRQQLLKQNDLVDKLLSVAIHIKKFNTKVEQQEVMLQKLKDLEYEPCLLPLNPRMEVFGINWQKCKVMGSKKRPLFLFLKNADSTIPELDIPSTMVIFKAGDDIRQDTLTLQILKIMDNVWKIEPDLGDLCLNPYGCVSTGDMCGFIEVVVRSETIASITKNAGGASAALKKTPLYDWLKSKNSAPDMEKVVERFVKSCAAYCVFTYALGIGDRHNDNIMMQETGELLHIDFGHFLGNIKTFAGVKRESAPFVFTNAYCHVICADALQHDRTKSNNFARFQDYCFKTFQTLRVNGHLFMVLLKLMCNSGIPELRTQTDIKYLRVALAPQKTTSEEVREFMCDLIQSSLTNKRTKVNEYLHILLNEYVIQ